MTRRKKESRVVLDGHKLRSLRKEMGLSQSQVAQRCGLGSHSVISKIEMELQNPELETAVILADFYGVLLDSLIKRRYIPAQLGEPPQAYQERRDLIDEVNTLAMDLSKEDLERVKEYIIFLTTQRRRAVIAS
jgi:transcriptional regulator with XRE-family HTH domain